MNYTEAFTEQLTGTVASHDRIIFLFFGLAEEWPEKICEYPLTSLPKRLEALVKKPAKFLLCEVEPNFPEGTVLVVPENKTFDS